MTNQSFLTRCAEFPQRWKECIGTGLSPVFTVRVSLRDLIVFPLQNVPLNSVFQTIPYDNIIEDNLGIYNTVSSTFTIPEDGKYRVNHVTCISKQLNANANINSYVRLIRGGVPTNGFAKGANDIDRAVVVAGNAVSVIGNQIIDLLQGDVLEIRIAGTDGVGAPNTFIIFGDLTTVTVDGVFFPALTYVELERLIG